MLGRVVVENGVKKIVPLTADAGAGNPVGTIIPMYKKSNPSGYLYCDGSTFDQTKYPLLYAYLGSNVLPDYREFALVGAEQNTTDTIATHDVYTQGEFKDDQFQFHKHNVAVDGNVNYQLGASQGWNQTMQNSATVALSSKAIPVRTSNMTSNVAFRNGDVTRGKRKAVYFYIKATSGLSEGQQDNVVAQLNEERSYSETEINTGKKWIDGKPIYKKTIDCGALPSSGDKNVNHNISNLGYVTEIDGFSYNSTTKLTLNIPHTYTSEAQCVSVVVSETNIVLHVGTDRSTYNKTYVTLEYTKTTD